MFRKILKIIGIILITLLGLASILFTAPFSKTNIEIGLGGIAIGVVFLIYALIFSYAGSLLMFWSSFWRLSRGVSLFLGISGVAYFLLILNNLVVFATGSQFLVIFIPLILYLIAAAKFFIRFARGRK